MFVQNGAEESVGVWEPLRAGTLSHADHTVLLGVQDTALGEVKGGETWPKQHWNLEFTAKIESEPRNYSQNRV